MGRLFGTDGVRGIANVDLTPELAYKLGKAGAFVLTGETAKTRILVGMDKNIGQMLKSTIVSGICSMGAQAIVLGIMPTPALAILQDIIMQMQTLLFPRHTILLNLMELNF